MVDRLISIDTAKDATDQLPVAVRTELDALWVSERDGLQVHKAGAETVTGQKSFAAKTFTKDVEVAPLTAGGTASLRLNNGAGQTWELGATAAALLALLDVTNNRVPFSVAAGAVANALRILASTVQVGVDLDMAGHNLLNTGNVNVANGLLQLDGNGRVPTGQLTVDAMQWKGSWNPATNTPTLADGVGSPGDVWRATTAGSANLGSGSITFAVGDMAVLSDTNVWQRINASDAVASVAGLVGAISATNLRTALALVVGTNVQAWDADLDAIAGLTSAADRLPYFTGSNAAALATFTAFARTLVDDPDAATARTTLGARPLVSRIGTVTSAPAPAINVDNVDQFNITALATAITSMTTGLAGTATDGQSLLVRIKDNGTAQGITWGAGWRSLGVALPTTTAPGKTLYIGAKRNAADSLWDVLAVGVEA